MVYVLGVGSAFPETTITNEILQRLGFPKSSDWVRERTGIESRRSVLPLDYLERTGNSDSGSAVEAAIESPTDLAFRAATKALEMARVNPDQIGLVLGDSSTPYQTTPSEAQRVTSRFGLKIPAYDIVGNSASFVLHLETIFNWRADKTPEYVLCLTTNAPTLSVNYRKGIEGAYFGDAAGAVVLSRVHSGKLKIREARCKWLDGVSPDGISIDTYLNLSMSPEFIDEKLRPRTEEFLNDVKKKSGSSFKEVKVICPELDILGTRSYAERAGLKGEQILSNGGRYGDSLGSSAITVLAENWSTFAPKGHIHVLQGGAGAVTGSIHFEVEK